MTARTLLALGVVGSLALGCGQGNDKPYQAKPAYSGKKPSLPQQPTLPAKAKKEGEAYTVWGAIHDLRSEVHSGDFEGKPTALVGWVVATNFGTLCKDKNAQAEDEPPCVPECAVHKSGKADPTECNAPVPTFWIADDKEEKDIQKNAIPVRGFASNFAQLFTAIEEIDKDDEAKYMDIFFGAELTDPLPNVGGKVKVTGSYGYTYTKSTGAAASNPRTGILTWDKHEWLEKPAKRAVLPGMKVSNEDVPTGEKKDDKKK
jgi:hypothetical protein